MITNLHKNRMGTVSFSAQFPRMRKPQDFIVYPMTTGAVVAVIQSETRIGEIALTDGYVRLSLPRPGGAHFVHMVTARVVARLSSEELLLLKASIMATASRKAGTNGIVYCDNSAALDVFGVQS